MNAFALDYSGPPTRCDYPGCTLESYHDGDHLMVEKPKPPKFARRFVCSICGREVLVYGEIPWLPTTCDEQACILEFARRTAPTLSVVCCCRQRSYPHDLSVHFSLRSESFNPKLKSTWPWSLCLSPRLEPSTEREAA